MYNLTIYDTIKHIPNAKTFLLAIWAGGLAPLLQARGQRTVFLPTDEAFKKISIKSYRELFREKAKLVIVLAFHIIPAKLKLAELACRTQLKTLFDLDLKITATDEVEISVDDANIVQSDIQCTNGVIHLIDSVLVPKVNAEILKNIFPKFIIKTPQPG